MSALRSLAADGRQGPDHECVGGPRMLIALFNKGVRLGALDRSAEEIAVYDDLLARFGTATELPLREQVANALFNKGATLGAPWRYRRLSSASICAICASLPIWPIGCGGAITAATREELRSSIFDKARHRPEANRVYSTNWRYLYQIHALRLAQLYELHLRNTL
jgi:hypothetical protein